MNRLMKISLQNRILLGIQNARIVVPKHNLSGAKSFASRENTKDHDLNKPIPFFGTSADKVRVTPQEPDRPKYSPYIVQVSLAIFLIYFCILREENDIDDLFKRDLFDYYGEEGSRLKKAYDYNIKHNLPTTEIIDRLREIGAPVPPKR